MLPVDPDDAVVQSLEANTWLTEEDNEDEVFRSSAFALCSTKFWQTFSTSLQGQAVLVTSPHSPAAPAKVKQAHEARLAELRKEWIALHQVRSQLFWTPSVTTP